MGISVTTSAALKSLRQGTHMERLEMQPWDVASLVTKTQFKGRKCSDGQCCSYNLDDPDLPERVLDKSNTGYLSIRKTSTCKHVVGSPK